MKKIQFFYHFLLFSGKLKRRSTGWGWVVWRVKILWKLTRSAWDMRCATGKFSNFENLPPIQKYLKILPPI
jgi:hypothetical protein